MFLKLTGQGVCLVAVLMAFGSQIARGDQPPSAAEQSAYQAAEQAVIDAVNSFRADQSSPLAALTPIVQLGKAARIAGETYLADQSPDHPATATAAGYTGNLLGVIPVELNDDSNYDPTSFIESVQDNSTVQSILLNTNATEIGVGFAMNVAGSDTRLSWVVYIGRRTSPGTPSGTNGLEVDSGRGLPTDLTDNAPIMDGRLKGDSVTGYTLTFFTPEDETIYQLAYDSLKKKALKIKGKVGKPLRLNIPFGLVNAVQKFVVKGKLPPGIKYSKNQGAFGGFTGVPTREGVYSPKLGGALFGPIDGTDQLPPIKLKFIITD